MLAGFSCAGESARAARSGSRAQRRSTEEVGFLDDANDDDMGKPAPMSRCGAATSIGLGTDTLSGPT